MTRKKRKALNDSLAEEFVYGEAPEEEESENMESNPEKDSMSTGGLEDPTHLNNQTSKLMDKLQTPSKEATKRFTVDLAQSTHRKLSILAAKTGRSKADIVRVLIDDALEDIPE